MRRAGWAVLAFLNNLDSFLSLSLGGWLQPHPSRVCQASAKLAPSSLFVRKALMMASRAVQLGIVLVGSRGLGLIL